MKAECGMMNDDRRRLAALLTAGCLLLIFAPMAAAEEPELPLLLEESFEESAERWAPFDPAAWRLSAGREGQVFAQVAASQYEPPHRSPVNIALLKDVTVGDFTLDLEVRSTVADYGHRDVCLVFGYQDAAHFYYVHLGKLADDHANQVFVVDDAPRTKISTKTTEGTPWDDAWHHVRIERRVEEGSIAVYFDDLEKPAMTATDRRFAAGQIGIGTFDDTAEFDDVRLRGVEVSIKP
jgi:hypothetical protein